MTAADRTAALPKYLRVATAIRRQIADGTLRPGQPAPSGAELSRAFGFSTLTCRKALRALIADGLLVPGPSRNARPRVADPAAPDLERDLADAARALSAGLAARRHEAGLTQAELAELARVSVTTVGHAETGRTWQSRRFWERADAALHAGGDLLRLHDAYRAASSPQQRQRSTADSIERTLGSTRPLRAPSLVPAPSAGLYPVDSAPAAPGHGDPYRNAPSPARPPQAGPSCVGPSCVGTSRAFATLPGPAQVSHAQAGTAVTAELGIAQVTQGQLGPSQGAVQVGPSRIVIVWTDGTVTTVHAPEVTTVPAPQVTTVHATEVATVPAPQVATVPAPEVTTVHVPEVATVPAPQVATVHVPEVGPDRPDVPPPNPER
jgi:DNA-binding transcriptional regulator YhcF (GntR family)